MGRVTMATPSDRQVLNSILNPTLPLGEAVYDPEEQVEDEVTRQDSKDVLDTEQSAVRAADSGDLAEALKLFDRLVTLDPKRPSSYNNRAQALRLTGRTDSALKDLNKAIELREGRDDDAMDDFKIAAENGSGFAKAMLVEMNPYAAMCNAMLKNVFSSLQQGENTDGVMERNLKNMTG